MITSAHKLLSVCMISVLLITLAACGKKDLSTGTVTPPLSFDQEEDKELENADVTPSEAADPEDINDHQPSDAPKEDVSEKAVNNGGLYVKHNGFTYYRRYQAGNFETTGLWGDYYILPGLPNEMMRLKEDGTSEVAFADDGSGDIYICNDRMYLQRQTDYISVVYSVDPDGSNKKDLFYGSIEGIDEASDTLVCILLNKDDKYVPATLNTITGKITELELTIPYTVLLTVHQGFIYYLGEVDYQASALGKMKLCRVAIDGTQEQLLAESDGNLYEFDTFGTEIPCLQFVDDTIYFSYGGYAGTGHFYQGGLIARVNTDGSDYKVLAGTVTGTEYYSDLVYDSFIVVKEGNRKTLYFTEYSEDYEGIRALDLLTGEVIAAPFVIHPEGVPFEYNGGVSIYRNASPTMTTLIPTVDYSTLGFGADEYYYRIHDIQQCGSWVYYRVEANEYNPDVSIGWRDGYTRIKTQVFREEVSGGKKELLYEY